MPAAVIPSIALTEYKGHVADQAAMVALTAEPGDWCIRDDAANSGEWVLTASPASTASNWIQIVKPYSAVTSVAGRTGAITLSYADVSGLGDAATHAASYFALASAFDQGVKTTDAVTYKRVTIEGGVGDGDPDQLGINPSAAQTVPVIWVYNANFAEFMCTVSPTGEIYGSSLQLRSGGNFQILGGPLVEVSGSALSVDGELTSSTRFTSGSPNLSSVGGTVTIDASAGNQFDMTLTADVTLANPTNPAHGQGITITLTQNGTGGWLITLDTAFNDPFGVVTAINARTSANARNRLSAIYHSPTSQWDLMPDLGGGF
jgi:hypothetical protein